MEGLVILFLYIYIFPQTKKKTQQMNQHSHTIQTCTHKYVMLYRACQTACRNIEGDEETRRNPFPKGKKSSRGGSPSLPGRITPVRSVWGDWTICCIMTTLSAQPAHLICAAHITTAAAAAVAVAAPNTF